jgi:hypothetical protein
MIVVALVTGWVLAASGQQPSVLQMGPARERGASVTPAFEGWYTNPDGSFSLLIGYFNRNSKEAVDIPIGPNNRIEPGPPDQGQPTHFEIGRQWGVFVLKVPKDFGNKVMRWTLTVNGETQTIPFTLNPAYVVTPYRELGMGNRPPVLWFSPGGAKVTGPPDLVAAQLSGLVNQPIPISVWVEDPKAEHEGRSRGGAAGTVANVSFHKYRGPGDVTFDRARVAATTQSEMIAAAATASAPGEYLLRIQANDESGEGGGGFQCCWTNTYVKLTVK